MIVGLIQPENSSNTIHWPMQILIVLCMEFYTVIVVLSQQHSGAAVVLRWSAYIHPWLIH